MFNYSLRTKIILAAMLIIAIVGLVFLLRYDSSRARDLELVTQAKNLASSFEVYYDKFNQYPQISQTDVRNISIISEGGVNKTGQEVYFQKNFEWAGSATVASQDNNYVISFTLDNDWELWSVEADGTCQIRNNVVISCQN